MFWHVYPLGFCGAPIWDEPDAAPRLRTITRHLDYLLELGLNGLLLGPIFSSRTHGYDTLDFYSIDPRLGTIKDFDDLVAECKRRGIRILLDGVFSHADAGFVRSELLSKGEFFEGHHNLVRFKHTDEQVAAMVSEVMRFWLDRGIDGWRLDAAYSIPSEFWAPVLSEVKRHHPDALLLGEVIHGEYQQIISESGMDTLTQYELWKAIWSAIKDRNFFELEWTLRRHNELLDAFIPQTFIGNHDVTRIATTVGRDAAIMAAAILFTLGGIPSVYYGDELGFTATKHNRFRGDDAIRPAFPDSPTPNEVTTAYRELIALRRRQEWLVDARTEVTNLRNEELKYRVYSGDKELFVHLNLENAPKVHISDPFGETLWTFGA